MENPEQEISGVIHSLTEGTREEQAKALDDYFLPNAYFVHPYCRVPPFQSTEVRIPLTDIKWTVNSRWLLSIIYQWYKILSPKILLEVDSTCKSTSAEIYSTKKRGLVSLFACITAPVMNLGHANWGSRTDCMFLAFDSRTNSLYATIRQTFTIWLVPFDLWQANVRLVCLLKLAHLPVDENKQPLLQNESEQIDHNENTATPSKRYFIRGQEDHYQINDALKFILPLGASPLYYVWQLLATFLCAIGVALLWPVTSIYERGLSDSAKNGNKNGRKSY